MPEPRASTLPSATGVRLSRLALAVAGDLVAGRADPLVLGVTLDSRRVQPGHLYAALPGATTHGARFGAQAAAAGAVAVLTDATGGRLLADAGVDLPTIVTCDPRAVLGGLSATVYGHPAERLLLFGVTGTNGKTTTTYLLHSALTALGRHAGLIGTVEIRIGSERVKSVRTTPESPDLQALFAQMLAAGADSCAMEISSHALALHRVDGLVADVAGFTNLSQDHLDFHDTLEEYFLAKAALFSPEYASAGVVCVDDGWGRRLAQESTIPITTLRTRLPAREGNSVAAESHSPELGAGPADSEPEWRLTHPEPDGRLTHPEPDGRLAHPEPDWRLTHTEPDPQGPGMLLVLTHRDGHHWHLNSPLPGDFNVSNTALAAVMLLRAGFDPAEIAHALRQAPPVPGRMQVVVPAENAVSQSAALQSADPESADPQSAGHPAAGLDPAGARSPGGAELPLAVVDYAHSPDSISAALAALRRSGSGPLVIVLGAGGDRDRSKREAMGAAAVRGADAVIVTDDNPRSEPPAAIRSQVLSGARAALPARNLEPGPLVLLEEVGDRRAAIERALELVTVLAGVPGAAGETLRPTVLVAGKGHETGQEVAGTVHPFDDRVVLADALTRLAAQQRGIAR